MDYSLLIGITYDVETVQGSPGQFPTTLTVKFRRVSPNHVRKVGKYAFGIIDYLQTYNWQRNRKVFERLLGGAREIIILP
eukprot:UN11658